MGGPGYVDGEEREEFDNFYPCCIEKDGICYPSAEHFFHAHKTLDVEKREAIARVSLNRVYAAGHSLQLRPDWESIKLRVMLEANELKYAQNAELRDALLRTQGDMYFTPSAGFWGVKMHSREGENWNGRIHAAVRASLRGEEETYQRVVKELDERCHELGLAVAARALG
eukprot:TRINITY_DN113238_c0_g1_i1.p1 TRINITY_DN113238_c0_g1~~TRINITY_DN113238_c0_g1_i1.p1  ORF type:complete len:170 (+),score=28.91 TRINITY_DN113238_c0_g1_i1:55-564(+)